MSSTTEPIPVRPTGGDHVPAAELARRQGVRPVTSVDDLARPELFESDTERDEFLDDLYASRRAGTE